jgi:hypothetical protein
MRIPITFLILFSTQIFSQTFLGISYNNSDPTNSTNLSLIQKITFSSTDITFLLTDNSTVLKTLSTITKMTFSGTNGGNPLPVELVNFAAQVNGNSVTLEWSTATEVNNYGFEVERRIKNEKLEIINWQMVGFVNGNGNSNSPKDYSFVDKTVLSGKYSYRLKQIDNDGKYEYSVAIDVYLGMPKDYNLSQNYPNPFNPATKIAYSIPTDGFVTLKVFDALGREVASLLNENKKAGSYEVVFDGSQLASGIYICKMSSANYTSSIKMIIVK